MNESERIKVVSIVALVLVIGLTFLSVNGKVNQSDRTERYRSVVKEIDGAMETVRTGGDPSETVSTINSKYMSLTSGENFSNRPDLESLDNDITKTMIGVVTHKENTELSTLRSLESDVETMAGHLGAGLPIVYKYPALIILVLAVSLAFLGSVLSRKYVDWDELKETQETMEEWKKKIREAKRKKGKKKKRKLDLKNENLIKKREKGWEISFKQTSFYLGPFLLLLALFGFVYGDWTVLWLPFTISQVLEVVGPSVGYFGWTLITFFGFAQIFREVILPKVS